MPWIIAYLVAGLTFGALDFAWLRWAGPNVYRPLLGDILADKFRAGPAIAFYVLYVAGMVWFAVRPGTGQPPVVAVFNGALLGGLCYATYDLTNQATLRQWSGQVTAADIAWGAAATAVASGLATLVTSRLAI